MIRKLFYNVQCVEKRYSIINIMTKKREAQRKSGTTNQEYTLRNTIFIKFKGERKIQ